MIPNIFPALAIIFVIATLYAEWRHLKILLLVAKPLASLMFLLAALSIHVRNPHDLCLASENYYRSFIIVALTLGLIGDCFLISDKTKFFCMGLIVFLFGHLVYAWAYYRLAHSLLNTPTIYVISLVSISCLIYYLLFPKLAKMRIPVALYCLVITLMLSLALTVFFSPGLSSFQRLTILIGSICFYISDISVAVNRFVFQKFYLQLFGLPLYYVAQFLLAYSVMV